MTDHDNRNPALDPRISPDCARRTASAWDLLDGSIVCDCADCRAREDARDRAEAEIDRLAAEDALSRARRGLDDPEDLESPKRLREPYSSSQIEGVEPPF